MLDGLDYIRNVIVLVSELPKSSSWQILSLAIHAWCIDERIHTINSCLLNHSSTRSLIAFQHSVC
jgi:hypothetical protein